MTTADDFWNAAQAAHSQRQDQAQAAQVVQAGQALERLLTQCAGAPCALVGTNLVLDFRGTPLLVTAQGGGAWDLSSSTSATQRLSAEASLADLYLACLTLTLRS